MKGGSRAGFTVSIDEGRPDKSFTVSFDCRGEFRPALVDEGDLWLEDSIVAEEVGRVLQ